MNLKFQVYFNNITIIIVVYYQCVIVVKIVDTYCRSSIPYSKEFKCDSQLLFTNPVYNINMLFYVPLCKVTGL